LSAKDVQAIQAQNLDFLLCFGFPSLTGDIIDTARLGAWAFEHGDGRSDQVEHSGFEEIVDRQPVIRVALRRLSNRAGSGHILREGWFRAAPESFARTRDRLFLGSAGWPALVCRAVRLGISDAAASSSAPAPASPASTHRTPGLGTLLRFMAVTVRARLGRYWHHGLRHDHWNIGIIDAPVGALMGRRAISGVSWAPEKPGHYAADPFGRWESDGLRTLFEDYSHGMGAAVIARMMWTREYGWSKPEAELDIGSHLSYPFLFDHGGRQLMLPESRSSGELVLYESDGSPSGWRPLATMNLGVDVADATPLHHEGRWWLFAARGDRLNPATELLLWYADRPEGPWTQHPLNPVLVDVRSARPAGPCFIVDGLLYRPAQDCSTGYGDRLAIKRITVLSPEQFEEEVVSVLEPDPDGAYPFGLHTLTAVGDVTLVDGKRRVRDWKATIRGVRSRLPF